MPQKHSKEPDALLPMILITVEDTGIGISDKSKETLFQPFSQVQRSAGGTGLGLFSLARRMEALGGACGVRNRSDAKQGSLFWFKFPYHPGSITSPCEATEEFSELSPLPHLRVLVVDDTVSVVKTVKRFLIQNGHEVETAQNGNQGLERLKKEWASIDILITDLQMPVMVT